MFEKCKILKDFGGFIIYEVSNNAHILNQLEIPSKNVNDILSESKLILIVNKTSSHDIRILALNDYLPLVCDMVNRNREPLTPISEHITPIINGYIRKNRKLLWFGIKVNMGISRLSNVSRFENYVYHNDKWAIFSLRNNYIVINLNVSDINLIKCSKRNKFYDDIDDPIFFYVSKSQSRTITGTSNESITDPVVKIIEDIENGDHPKSKTILEKLKDFFLNLS